MMSEKKRKRDDGNYLFYSQSRKGMKRGREGGVERVGSPNGIRQHEGRRRRIMKKKVRSMRDEHEIAPENSMKEEKMKRMKGAKKGATHHQLRSRRRGPSWCPVSFFLFSAYLCYRQNFANSHENWLHLTWVDEKRWILLPSDHPHFSSLLSSFLTTTPDWPSRIYLKHIRVCISQEWMNGWMGRWCLFFLLSERRDPAVFFFHFFYSFVLSKFLEDWPPQTSFSSRSWRCCSSQMVMILLEHQHQQHLPIRFR